MKKVILLVVFLPYMAKGQIIENFESATLDNWIQSTEGHWSADTTKSISGSFSLHHIYDNPSGGSDCIGRPLVNLHPAEGLTRWTFQIRHGYDPSSSNNWSVYLMSDADPVSFGAGTSVNGFAVGVNLTGYDDTLRLWKIRDGLPSVIASSPVNWQNNIGTDDAAKIIAERTIKGEWNIRIYDNTDNLKGSATGSDSELFNSLFFILNYRYTSTRDRLLWFDDLKIEGVFYEDRRAPEVISCKASGINSLDITLNEEPDDNFMKLSNFSMDNEAAFPVRIEKRTAVSYNVSFNIIFKNKVLNNLIIKHLCDRIGNCSDNVIAGFIPLWADPGDIIISEIMADPLPAVSLPGKEYLEITNRTRFEFNLKKWSLSVENQSTSLPSFVMKAGEYLILCSVSDTSLFSGYGKVIGMKSFPGLTDEGRMLYLSDSMGNLMHGLEYSSSWYSNKLKSGGGWSLELIDTKYPFYTKGNWEASSSVSGGTPGRINSASRSNPDHTFYGIENVFPDDSLTVSVRFSETVHGLAGSPGKISIGEKEVASVSSSDPLVQTFMIKPSEPLKKKDVYSFNISNDVTDFAGNRISRNLFRFGLPENTAKGDMLFNELLFNPFPEEPDYLELVNCSDKIIDASNLFLISVNDETGDTSDIKQVSAEHRCIIPRSYYTVTTDPGKIANRYFTSDEENIFNMASLPSTPDDKGHLILLDQNLEILDEVHYSDKMHFPLLAGNEGVSLEKVRPELPSGESINWHSASESCGWGTPGKENSVYCPGSQTTDQVTFSSKRISPDNDGNEDVLIIDIKANGLGNIVSVTVFDETGSYVRKIRENLFAESKASVVWDGTSDDGSLVSTGIYIVLIEMYNDKGKTKSWKKVCTVIR